jgi:predicted nucleic acid-binding protein
MRAGFVNSALEQFSSVRALGCGGCWSTTRRSESTRNSRRSMRWMPLGETQRRTGTVPATAAKATKKRPTRAELTPSSRCATSARHSLRLSGSPPSGKLLIPLVRRDVRVVEGARLESVCRGNSTVGSNPTLSANLASRGRPARAGSSHAAARSTRAASVNESHSLRQLPRLWLGRCRFVCAARSRPAIAIYVLDTNPVSELMKGTEGFVERLASHAPSDITIPQPVVAQIAYGIERVAAFQASNRVAVSFRSDLLGDSDTAIAAHALAFDATLVTSNLDRMTRVPRLKVEHWTQ